MCVSFSSFFHDFQCLAWAAILSSECMSVHFPKLGVFLWMFLVFQHFRSDYLDISGRILTLLLLYVYNVCFLLFSSSRLLMAVYLHNMSCLGHYCFYCQSTIKVVLRHDTFYMSIPSATFLKCSNLPVAFSIDVGIVIDAGC